MSILILLAALVAGATPASTDSGAATALHVGLRRTLQLERPAVTAAYAVDDTLVEASVADGRVRIYGVRPGTTQVALVSAQGVETLPVTVDRPPSRVFASAPGAARGQSTVQAGFDSQTGRLSAGLDAVSHSAGRTVRLRVASVTGTASGAGEERGTALQSVALSVEAGGRALVLGTSGRTPRPSPAPARHCAACTGPRTGSSCTRVGIPRPCTRTCSCPPSASPLRARRCASGGEVPL